MTSYNDFLVEIGTEELPPKALNKLSLAFAEGIKTSIEKAELNYQNIQCYASPRRLAVMIDGLAGEQQDKAIERRGPALKAAFNAEGKASPAALGFAKSCGVSVDELERLETPQGAWLVFRSQAKGKTTNELMPAIVENALNQLPIPKRMRWGNESHQFVRPVHWLLMLFGDRVVPCEILGCSASRETYGHRFHHPNAISIDEPKQYASKLENYGYVIADFQQRKEKIKKAILETASHVNGDPVIDNKLLDEVTGLVEWPVSVLANFDEKYLAIPPEALVSAMKAHQKYFHFVDKNARLLPQFITIANIQSSNPDSVRLGNERVIRPRLADAEFFWEQDKKIKLADRLGDLKNVVFQNQLGTLYDKVKRVIKLSGSIAEVIGGDVMMVERAAHLSKCDLLTEMVGEFPELQGTMGQYYARHDGEHEEVMSAMMEQYMPRFAGDTLPFTKTGQALSIADKLDSLVGIFGIKQIPTGDKDPFALRRAALGVLRIIIENRLPLDLLKCIDSALETYTSIELDIDTKQNVFHFILERLRSYYIDQGVDIGVFESVLAIQPQAPYDFDQRLRAVAAFQQQPEVASLVAANKRIRNILRKSTDHIPGTVDQSLLSEKQEQNLFAKLETLENSVVKQTSEAQYDVALSQLAGLKNTVDEFFDHIMVNVDDNQLRANRLALLRRLQNLFLSIADFSELG